MTPDDLTAVRSVIKSIDTRPPVDELQLRARHKSYVGWLFERALSTGGTLGEADRWRGTVIVSADYDENRAHWKNIANDIPYLTDVLGQAVAHYYETGTQIAPYPAQRICINLRRSKEFALEVDFLRALLKFPNMPHSAWFEHRLKKALILRNKAAATARPVNEGEGQA